MPSHDGRGAADFSSTRESRLSKQLGHKSVVITAKHYAHVIGDDVADAVRELSGDMGIG